MHAFLKLFGRRRRPEKDVAAFVSAQLNGLLIQIYHPDDEDDPEASRTMTIRFEDEPALRELRDVCDRAIRDTQERSASAQTTKEHP